MDNARVIRIVETTVTTYMVKCDKAHNSERAKKFTTNFHKSNPDGGGMSGQPVTIDGMCGHIQRIGSTDDQKVLVDYEMIDDRN